MAETYKDIESELDVNSIKLINLAIKLEFINENFPFEYAEKLINQNKQNILPDFLIKDYLYTLRRLYRKGIR